MVSLGGMPDPETYLMNNRARDAKPTPRPDGITNLPRETEAAMLRLVRIFASMTRAQVLALHAMLNGDSGAAAARRIGVTKQAVSKQIQLIAGRFPELAEFFAQMRYAR